MELININSIYTKKNIETAEDVAVRVSIVNLKDYTTEYCISETMTLSDLVEKANSGNYLCSNFYLKDGFPNPMERMLPFHFVTDLEYLPLNSTNDSSYPLTRVINELQMGGCLFKFEPYMYKDITGDSNFENFTPELNSILVPFKNLIVSSKKFNIVFSAVIPGEVKHGEDYVMSNRFYPFKAVKGGNLVFDKLTVVVPSASEVPTVLKNYGTPLSDTVYELDLTQFEIFDGRYVPVSTDMIAINILLDELKVKVKAMKYVKDIIHSYLAITGEIDASDNWYRGDKVFLDTVSDEGMPILEVYLSGEKSKPSVETILSGLLQIGESFRKLVTDMLTHDITPTLSETNKVKFHGFIDKIKELNYIDDYANELLKQVAEYTCLEGTINEKYKTILRLINAETLKLNCLELKFLNLRFGLLTQLQDSVLDYNEYANKGFGHLRTSRATSNTYHNGLVNYNVTVSRKYVKGVTEETPLSELFNGYFKDKTQEQDSEGVKQEEEVNPDETSIREISTDFRKED